MKRFMSAFVCLLAVLLIHPAEGTSSSLSVEAAGPVEPALVEWLKESHAVPRRHALFNRQPDFHGLWSSVRNYLEKWPRSDPDLVEVRKARANFLDAAGGYAGDIGTEAVDAVLEVLALCLSQERRGLDDPDRRAAVIAVLNAVTEGLSAHHLNRDQKLAAVQAMYRYSVKFFRPRVVLPRSTELAPKWATVDQIVLAHARVLHDDLVISPDSSPVRTALGLAPPIALLVKLPAAGLKRFAAVMNAWKHARPPLSIWTRAKWAFVYTEVRAMLAGNLAGPKGTFDLLIRYAGEGTVPANIAQSDFLRYVNLALRWNADNAPSPFSQVPISVFRYIIRYHGSLEDHLLRIFDALCDNVAQHLIDVHKTVFEGPAMAQYIDRLDTQLKRPPSDLLFQEAMDLNSAITKAMGKPNREPKAVVLVASKGLKRQRAIRTGMIG